MPDELGCIAAELGDNAVDPRFPKVGGWGKPGEEGLDGVLLEALKLRLPVGLNTKLGTLLSPPPFFDLKDFLLYYNEYRLKSRKSR